MSEDSSASVPGGSRRAPGLLFGRGSSAVSEITAKIRRYEYQVLAVGEGEALLSRVSAVRFDKVMNSGKSRPCLVICEDHENKEIEVVVKFAAGCDNHKRALANEAIAACFAADLNLPVPEPFLVSVTRDFGESIPDRGAQKLALASLGWNFGSKKLPAGYSVYPSGYPIPQELLHTATEIIAFDWFIENFDRRVANPNLLWNRRQFAIFDHEYAFLFDLAISWKPTWEGGSFSLRGNPERRHIFFDFLKDKELDFSRIEAGIAALTGDRFRAYVEALPEDWVSQPVESLPAYFEALQTNLRGAMISLVGALR